MATGRDENGRANRRSKWDSPAQRTAPTSGSATDAAREAARKLNAMLAAKGKLNINTTPPLLPPKPKSTAGTNNDSSSNSSEMFSDEVEINDSPRRLLLCKGTVQYEINKYSGAAVSTKGQYIPASEKANFEGQRPLSLFIQASSADKVQLAVKRIQGILNGDDPFTAPPIQPHRPFQASQSPALPSGMHYVQEKVFVGLDNVPPEFNLKEKIVGPGESFFQHITRETGAKIQLRGRGSGFLEPTSGREAFETLYVYISHNSYAGLAAAKKLVENLIQTVTNTYHTFQMQRSSNTHYSNYDGHGAGPPPHRMYMPPVPRYGIPPHPNGTPSYPPYPHPHNQYPPRYNQPQQPPPNRHMHPNPSLPPHVPVLYPNQQPIHEGPRPRMNEQHLPHGGSYSSPTMRPPRPYVPMYPPVPHSSPRQEPPLSNNNRAVPQLPPTSEISSEAGNKLNQVEDKRPPDPPKRRFTEAPAKKVVPFQPPSDSFADKQRSVSSLDQLSIPVSALSYVQDEGHRRTMSPPMMPAPMMPAPMMLAPAMLAPTMPAPKVKPNNPKNDSTTFSGGFKAPFLPVSAPVSTAKKNVQSAAVTAGSKRKHDESEKKSTGFALLGSYDDSSDEDEEEATKRLGSNRP